MTADPPSPQELSWRDPSGFVVQIDQRIFRAVARDQAASIQKLLGASWFRANVSKGRFPESTWIDRSQVSYPDAERFAWLEHERLEFPIYPHEITALQLYDSAMLTLSIAREALDQGWILKDASAWNVLFDNGRPVFCDILSFSPVDDSGIWPAYGQFCRHFVIPLLLHKELGMQPAEMHLCHRDGITPEMAKPMLRGFAAYLPTALEAVTLPAWLAARSRDRDTGPAPQPLPRREPALARHLVGRTLTGLERKIRRLRPSESVRRTQWSDFENNRSHYAPEDLALKAQFVKEALDNPAITSVLDLGCNAGEFSRIGAALGKRVVAADYDHGAVSKLYGDTRRSQTGISPMLLNIGRPTPPVGWMNREVQGILDRAREKFDCVMVLGLMHHLLVSERAPLIMILELTKALDPTVLIVEWVEPDDRRFLEIAGINRSLYADLSSERFESVFSSAYALVRKCRLAMGSRTLFLWRKA